MVCKSCLEKLAYKLIEHHKHLDLIRAFELAEKAIGRVKVKEPEINVEATKKWGRVILKGYNPDYTQPCIPVGACSYGWDGEECYLISSTCNSTTCPDPLPNSHKISDCSGSAYCYFTYRCIGHCGWTGTCGYNCDTDYTWNGSACVLPSVVVAKGDGLTWIVS
jgi:hypothetical protein